MVEYQVESLRFIARRPYCNLEFMRHLRHCAGWQEIASSSLGSRICSAVGFESGTRGRRSVMNVRRPLQLGVLLTAWYPGDGTGAGAQQANDGSRHDGTMGQQKDQPMMGPSHDGQGKQDGEIRAPVWMYGGMVLDDAWGRSRLMQGGMGALFGSRVTPMMNLSAEDVRGYLGGQLDRLDNKRLKVGDIKVDNGTITADIVTVDNSLVQRLKVDRHTGAIEYPN
jgi:hypothetical protein